MPETQKITVTGPVIIEVTAPSSPGPQIAVREVTGGVVLDVSPELVKLLVDFGWQPPIDVEVGE